MPIICDKCKQVYLSYLPGCPLCAEMSAAANDYKRIQELAATNAALLEALQAAEVCLRTSMSMESMVANDEHCQAWEAVVEAIRKATE